jgi:hypothetical protein
MRLKSSFAPKRIATVPVRALAIALAYSCAICVLAPGAWCPASVWAATAQASSQVSESELSSAISTRIEKVPEFRFIREQAEKMGVKVYLFGGTAAGFGHYVKWDLQREKGDPRFQPDRFDYDYTNIYRSTQDLDIVLDGDEAQAQKLQALLQEKYPHLQGSKSAWEVRLLRKSMGDKEALLDNSDYLNQHTDSNSTGMIELTKPARGEPVIRDLRDWQSKTPHFLKDLQEGTLHYYYSPQHHTTARFKKGENPEIFSAIRYLTKAFQYELKIPPDDLKKIQEVIARFDPASELKTAYARSWIEKNGKKLMQHAVNLEYASNTLSELGLGKKLVAIKNNPGSQESLAWWLSKEPLRTKPVGEGSGKTAAEIAQELGVQELVVAHDTDNFLAYESITRAHTGDPNVLISRPGAAGEAAALGDGFYTQIGKKGAWDTGFTIRFTVDPRAREGSDFIRKGKVLVFRNKAAIRVIPESVKIGPVDYFRLLAGRKALDQSDRAIWEKFKRRLQSQLQAIQPGEAREILSILNERWEDRLLMKVWFALPVSAQHPQFVEALLKKGVIAADASIVTDVLSQPHWSNHPEWVEALIKRGTMDPAIAQWVLGQPHWSNHPELVDALLETRTADPWIAQYILSRPQWSNHREWVDLLLERGTADDKIAQYVLSQPHSANHPEWVELLLKEKKQEYRTGWRKVLQASSEWLRQSNIDWKMEIALKEPHWLNHPQLRAACGGREPTVECLKAAFKRGVAFKAPSGCVDHFGALRR